MALTALTASLTKRKALLLTLSTAAVAAGLAAPAQAAGPAAPALTWKPCQPGSAIECASLPVPLDYRKPGGPHLDLAVSRLRTDRPDARRGTLLVIAGGPGSSGNEKLARKGEELRKETRGAYDIVSLDPRGVGGSTKADCKLGEDDLEITHLRAWPEPDGGIGENVTRSRRIAEACARNGGETIRSFSTANEVRDIDRFRQALGEDKLSAWGSSYGTYVGAVYAQKYPTRTDRWVLDSNGDPDPRRVERGWLANMSGAADDRFPDFAKWAADPARDAKHRVAERPEDVRPLFLSLAAKLDRVPERAADGTDQLTGNRLRQALQMALYNDNAFPRLAEQIVAARAAGDRPLPFQPLRVSSTEAAVQFGVLCNDVRWPRSLPDYARDVAVDRARHPLTAGMPVNVTPCTFWPYDPTDKPTRITSEGPSNVLMVQNLRDPATPHRGALKMREAFGDRARMVSVDAGGHGAYLGGGNACGDGAVTEFLTTGRRPARDVLCTAAGMDTK
ncbi:alpha/beta hydrolase [Streptomyces sp. NPDC053048]|uniref:alpha/beta hydrolase n=1 Tax=Streptomyces sp. NPDC053048 TaxID=3365694 RepID=UPI0037D6FD90